MRLDYISADTLAFIILISRAAKAMLINLLHFQTQTQTQFLKECLCVFLTVSMLNCSLTGSFLSEPSPPNVLDQV